MADTAVEDRATVHRARTRSATLEREADARSKYGFYIVLAGLALIGVIYTVSIIVFSRSTPQNLVENMVGALGAVTGIIGSMVAGYFGIQLGTAGREKTEAAREDQRATVVAAGIPQDGGAEGNGAGSVPDGTVATATRAPEKPASVVPALIGELAKLRSEGVISDEEFEAKKADLLGRI